MIPTPHTLQVKRRVVTGKDSRGNDIIGYDAPHDWPVHGYAPGANEEPGLANRDLSLILWTILAPVSDLVPHERDQVMVAGDWHEVAGSPSDWSHGPWPFPAAGVVVLLKRAEG